MNLIQSLRSQQGQDHASKGAKIGSQGVKNLFFLMNKVQTYIDLHKQIVYLWYLNFMKGGRLWNGCQKGSLSGDNGKKKGWESELKGEKDSF